MQTTQVNLYIATDNDNTIQAIEYVNLNGTTVLYKQDNEILEATTDERVGVGSMSTFNFLKISSVFVEGIVYLSYDHSLNYYDVMCGDEILCELGSY
jgi:hypothetical protein